MGLCRSFTVADGKLMVAEGVESVKGWCSFAILSRKSTILIYQLNIIII